MAEFASDIGSAGSCDVAANSSTAFGMGFNRSEYELARMTVSSD
jgi:hypothetical protein